MAEERGEEHGIRGKHQQGSGNPARLVREGARGDTSPNQVPGITQIPASLTHLGFTHPNPSVGKSQRVAGAS